MSLSIAVTKLDSCSGIFRHCLPLTAKCTLARLHDHRITENTMRNGVYAMWYLYVMSGATFCVFANQMKMSIVIQCRETDFPSMSY